jgi:hypothetical protein
LPNKAFGPAPSSLIPVTNPQIFIATPMYGAMCYGTYATSLAQLVSVFLRAKMPFKLGVTYNDSLVTRARDSLAHDFTQTECTHLMFIDSDIGFQAEDILSMLAADKDIICGLYPHKRIDWEQVVEAVHRGVSPQELAKHTATFVVNTLDGASIAEVAEPAGRQPVEVANGGCGFMLIKRAVLEGLADKVPAYESRVDNPFVPKICKQFFDTSIDPADDSLLSEDYHFCKLARDNGYKVWAAPWVVLSHIGTYMFTGGLHARPKPSAVVG